MTPYDILMPVAALLAFIGYVTCLARFFWRTVALTCGLGFFVSRSFPLVVENLAYWAAAVGLIVFAMLTLRFLPEKPAPLQPRGSRAKDPSIVIDGTNVMYWDGEAEMSTLRVVVDHLKAKKLDPFVFLDASSRHHLKDKSLDERGFAKALGLARNRIMVCPARTEADAFILKFAREHGLPIVSNDRFSDRASQTKGLKLIKGGIAGGKPILQGL